MKNTDIDPRSSKKKKLQRVKQSTSSSDYVKPMIKQISLKYSDFFFKRDVSHIEKQS